MDKTKTYVQHISSTIAIPSGIELGAIFNYDYSTMLNAETKIITVPFACIGAMYDDYILVKEFNFLVEEANPQMANGYRRGMVKLSGFMQDGIRAKSVFNYKAYPRISDTYELEWYVSKTTYDTIKTLLTAMRPHGKSTTNTKMTNVFPLADSLITP
jgi:hypothetical protein